MIKPTVLFLLLATLGANAADLCPCSPGVTECVSSKMVDGVCVTTPSGGECESYHCDVSGSSTCEVTESSSCRGGLVVRPTGCSEDADCDGGLVCDASKGICAKRAKFDGLWAADNVGTLYMNGIELNRTTLLSAGTFSYDGPCGDLVARVANGKGPLGLIVYLTDKLDGDAPYGTGPSNGVFTTLSVLTSKEGADRNAYTKGEPYDFSAWMEPTLMPIRNVASFAPLGLYQSYGVREVGNVTRENDHTFFGFRFELPMC
eukprot:CAMPEP_0198332414 /NCGR_PEP_ID=MMETSP1450-20131203/18264_1 /TAXON_ID=753684 ORGANISM="Madagascaria erythrocladiodes, Strain CCMP3234" /NCGR_SAMPLE_ID=MMETSP1450 /ASSEMBLY_ACC=CAM_ASM_001115 /LENGTH=259 /DNA_ID=CAMNT_0044036869 /DNA_START=63 /DNA_END=842 /DNA_ORIENTATION=+